MPYHECPRHGEEVCPRNIPPNLPWYVKVAYPHSCQNKETPYYGNFTKKGKPMTTRRAIAIIREYG